MDNLYSTKRYYKDTNMLAYKGTGYDDANKAFVRHGEGKEYYSSNGKLKYEGGFVNSVWQGRGKEYYKNGKLKYKGSFYEDKRAGTGSVYDKAGTLICSAAFNTDGIITRLDRVGPVLEKYRSKEYIGFILNVLKNGMADTVEEVVSRYKKIPEKYCGKEAISFIISALKDGLADDVKEAVLLYENTMHRQRMEEEQKKQTELLGQLLKAAAGEQRTQAELLRSINETQAKILRLLESVCCQQTKDGKTQKMIAVGQIDNETQAQILKVLESAHYVVTEGGKEWRALGVVQIGDWKVRQDGKWYVKQAGDWYVRQEGYWHTT